MSGTTQLTTLRGTVTVGSKLELRTGAVLGGIEKAAWPAMAGATLVDVGAHLQCCDTRRTAAQMHGYKGLLLRDGEREKPQGASGADHVRLRRSRIGLVQVDAHNRQGHSCLCRPVCRADRIGYCSVPSQGCGILAWQTRGSLSVSEPPIPRSWVRGSRPAPWSGPGQRCSGSCRRSGFWAGAHSSLLLA